LYRYPHGVCYDASPVNTPLPYREDPHGHRIELVYPVPGVSCPHCVAAIVKEVDGVAGIESVDVDRERKLVTVRGRALDVGAVRRAIDRAGYDVESEPTGAPRTRAESMGGGR
jgi:copper chaperone